MGGSFRLKEITVEGFRGFGKKPATIDLSHPVTLIFGNNRSGKSSTLNAIEWALFGPQVIKKDFIAERKDWRTCNLNCSSAKVELTLVKDAGEIRVKREIGAGKKRSGGSFCFFDEQGRRSEDEGELHALLGLTAKGFMNTAYLHQEVLRDILVSTPSERKAALDRLLGASSLGELHDALRKISKNEYEKEIGRVFAGLQGLIESGTRSYRDTKKEALEDGEDLGIAEDDYTEAEFAARCETIIERLKALAEKAGIEGVDVAAPADHTGYKSFSREAEAVLDRLRSENPGAISQEQLLSTQIALEGARGRYSAKADKKKGLLVEKNELVGEGGVEGLKNREKSLLDRIDEINSELSRINRRLPVVNATITYLEELGEVTGTTSCPSCGQDVEPQALLEDLRALTGEFAEETRDSNNELTAKREENRKAGEKISRLREIEGNELPAVEAEISQIFNEVEELLGRKVGKDDDPEQLISTRLTEIADQLERNKSVLQEYNQGISEVTDVAKAAACIQKFLKAQDRVKELEGITASGEWNALDAARSRIFSELEIMEKVREAASRVRDEMREERLRRAEESIIDYYRTLVERPDFDAIRIDETDHDVYAVKDRDKEKVVTFFNQGDMNCVALSIFLALGGSEEKEGGPAFLILDDPSQSLDATQKRRLAKVVEKVAAGSQVILATMDEELLDSLNENISKAKKNYRLGEWDPISGPTIEG